MKRATVFCYLIGTAIAAIAIAASFYFDDSVRDFIRQHQNRAIRDFMRYVSLFGDWPSHTAVGLVLLWLAWRRGSQKWTRIFLAMLLAMAIAGVAGTVIKRTIPRARPSVKSELHWGGPRFSSKYHSFPSASTRRACVSPNPDSDRVLTDVHRRALFVRRRLRGGSGNFMRPRRSVLRIAARRRSPIENRKCQATASIAPHHSSLGRNGANGMSDMAGGSGSRPGRSV